MLFIGITAFLFMAFFLFSLKTIIHKDNKNPDTIDILILLTALLFGILLWLIVNYLPI